MLGLEQQQLVQSHAICATESVAKQGVDEVQSDIIRLRNQNESASTRCA